MFCELYKLAQGNLKLTDIPVYELQMHEIRIRVLKYIALWDSRTDGYEIPAEILTRTVKKIKVNELYDSPTIEIEVK